MISAEDRSSTDDSGMLSTEDVYNINYGTVSLR